MMTPVGRLVLVRTIDKRDLVNAMAWVTIPALIGPVIGPPVGGFITTYVSWHWIFLINIPIGLIGIVLVMLYIDPVRERASRAVRPSGHGAGRTGRRAASPSGCRSRASTCCPGRSSLAWSAAARSR